MTAHRLPWLKTEAQILTGAPGFVACPPALMAAWPGGECPWRAVYEVALERARRVVAPSLAERLYRNIDN